MARLTLAGTIALLLAGQALGQVNPERTPTPLGGIHAGPKVQIALLLDTSNSMDGLIDQAKVQLWNLVNELVMAKHEGVRPTFEVALIEYGNDSLPADGGHIRIVTNLTTDLDLVSKELFALATNGGEEYCGSAIARATEALSWGTYEHDLRVIFIAGNEPFTQGPVDYRSACPAAIAKGICVNTIFCGDQVEGLNTGWSDGARLADGSYSHIDQDQAIAHIPAPQDDEIARLGVELNTTYIQYGSGGEAGWKNQQEQDSNAVAAAPGALQLRAQAKASAAYCNTHWDLVDACNTGTVKLEEMKDEDLPETMRAMTLDERRAYVAEFTARRTTIQERIAALSVERTSFVSAKMKELAGSDETLGAALVKIIREQAQKRGYAFEK